MKTRQVLTAEDGMILTNGEIYGKAIYFAVDADVSAFYEITEAEYEKIMAEQEKVTEVF